MDVTNLIKQAGGSTAMAKLLGFGDGGAQRVQNWIARGRIPAQVQIDHAAKLLALHKREMKKGRG